MKNFIHNITKKYGEDFYVFGEFWNGDTEPTMSTWKALTTYTT